MDKSLKSGIFIGVVIVILFAGWVWLANVEFKKHKYEVVIKFSDVTGLKVNDPVKVGGVEKGNVKKIEYKGNYMEVRITMENDVILYSDANAEILDVAMISGTKYVRLNAGTSGSLLKPRTVIKGSSSLGIPLSILGDIGEKVNELLVTVDTLKLRAISKSIQTGVENLSQVIQKNKDNIEITVTNVKKSSNKLNNSLSHIDSMISDIKKGDGSLGQLTTSDTLYKELNATLSSIRELSQDIKDNPRKYLNFKLF